jgi:glycosyltransferase involved in cell wall biosynthesis
MYKGKRIAVVVPIHNEGAHLAQAISLIPSYVDTIVAIDDGSDDSTWSELCAIESYRLIRLRHESNLGVGAATKTGYRYLLNAGADFIAVMDGDGQMDGRDLWRLLERAIRGADYVKGNRFLHSATISRMPVARYIGNRTLSWLTRRAAHFEGSLDAQCGFTVVRRSALKQISLDKLYDRYGFPNEMFFAARREGLTVDSVAVRTIYGEEVSGINPFTAVPAILFLIARSYLRRKFGRGTAPLLVLSESRRDAVRKAG